MSDANQLAQLKMDAKTTLKASDIHIHNFAFENKGSRSTGRDILEEVARAARQATESRPQSSLKVGEFEVDFDSLRADLGDESPEDAALREARGLIKQEQYQLALSKLGEVLEVAPHHHEAIYLKALCKFKLKHLKAALTILLELKDAVLKNRLRTRVRALKEDIRQQTIPTAARAYAGAVKAKDAKDCIVPLREFVETDPEVGKFHYFLTGAYLINKQITEARETALNGLKVCETDREELEQLCCDIDREIVPRFLGPARDHFRTRKYRDAAAVLADVPNDVKVTSLWKTFDGYVAQFNGGKRGGLFSRKVTAGMKDTRDPPGTPAEIKELYEYLVEPEMNTARTALEANQLPNAERALQLALRCTPTFTVANHMLATCVYQRVGAKVKERIGKDIQDNDVRVLLGLKKELKDVRNHAVTGSRDTEIRDGKRVLKSIDEMCSEIDKVVDKHQTQTHDAKLVNKAIDDFIQVLLQMLELRTATSPWEIRRIAESLYGKLSSMRNEVRSARGKCKGSEAREVLSVVLDKFVEPNFTMLRRAMGR